MAELRKIRRGEIGRQHVKTHSCSHFGPCFDHTSPIQTDDGTSQIDHDIGAYVPRPLLFSNNVTGAFTSPYPTEVQGWRRQGQRLNVTVHWRDHLNWERGFSATMISPVFWRPWLMVRPRGLNSRPPAQQTCALPTELTVRRPCLPFLHDYFLFSTGRNGKLRLVFNRRTGKSHLRILRKSWRLLRHKNTRYLPYHRLKNKRLYL